MLKKNCNISEYISKIGLFAIILFGISTLSFGTPALAQKVIYDKQTVNKNIKTASEILSEIDKYQESYFTIVKRNDVLIQFEDNKNLQKDRKELKRLYKEVQKKVTNKEYLKKYNDIKKRYAKCDATSTIGMNEFADNNYNDIDDLLNEVYKDVKAKISTEDFKKLAQSETKWLNEVDSYQKIFDAMELGTIGTVVYYDYQINMREFRTLLLMMYL